MQKIKIFRNIYIYIKIWLERTFFIQLILYFQIKRSRKRLVSGGNRLVLSFFYRLLPLPASFLTDGRHQPFGSASFFCSACWVEQERGATTTMVFFSFFSSDLYFIHLYFIWNKSILLMGYDCFIMYSSKPIGVGEKSLLDFCPCCYKKRA